MEKDKGDIGPPEAFAIAIAKIVATVMNLPHDPAAGEPGVPTMTYSEFSRRWQESFDSYDVKGHPCYRWTSPIILETDRD